MSAHRRTTMLWAAFLARRLGPTGWLGIAALVAAGVLVLGVNPMLERLNAATAAQVEDANRHLSQLRDPAFARAHGDPTAALLASLPGEAEVPDFVANLQRRADDGAVQIDRTEYRVQPVLGRAARRYRLSFPAHVDYPHLRLWLEGLLHDYPSLVLDEISMRREVDGGEELEAHAAVSLLVRVGP